MKKLLYSLILSGFSLALWGQKTTQSPYSFYGLGTTRFAGNAENAIMGGVHTHSDSTRVDVRNPASLGELLLTSFSFGATFNSVNLKTENNAKRMQTTTIDYLSIGFPVHKKVGVAFGLTPYNSVGYKMNTTATQNNQTIVQTFDANGGINKLFLSAGYKVKDFLRLGVGFQYYFGTTTTEVLYSQSNISYMTMEQNTAKYSGLGFNFGAQYDFKIDEKLNVTSSLAYSPKTSLSANNNRVLSTLYQSVSSGILVMDTQNVSLANANEKTIIPSNLIAGVGIGQKSKWFVGVDYTISNNNEFNNLFFTSDKVSYQKGYKIGIGGFYTPQYGAFSSYWKRITYRAGFYFEDTGIVLNNQTIDDFGVTFGASLPVSGFSSMTIGGQFGRKGTYKNGLVQENYVGIRLGFSLNDRWFQKSKYH